MPATPVIPLFFSWVCAMKNRVRDRGFRAPVPAGRRECGCFRSRGGSFCFTGKESRRRPLIV